MRAEGRRMRDGANWMLSRKETPAVCPLPPWLRYLAGGGAGQWESVGVGWVGKGTLGLCSNTKRL